MPLRLRRFASLEGDQLRASFPGDHAALSASAGTGKTHVLTARVLRLLLAGVDPSAILCLTFTKAGAAEMAERIQARLAHWVRLNDPELTLELQALSEESGPEGRARARTLFAHVLDASGGGLRIQTIHAFAQSLLAAFPAEAGLTPGFRPLDGREEQQLVRKTLADMLVRAEQGGDHALIRDVQALSLRLGEGGAEAYLKACAGAPDALDAIGPREGIAARLRHVFELPLADIDEAIARDCGDDAFDVLLLRSIVDANRTWGTVTGLAACDAATAWLARDAQGRAETLEEIALIVLTAKGEPRRPSTGLLRAAPDYEALAGRLIDCCGRLLRIRAVGRLVDVLAAGLRAGQAFAHAYTEAKSTAGVADFDDLIRWAERLLTTDGMGDWVRYKLDQRIDHILVDEAQDTNARQWRVIGALAEEFFSGERAEDRRTIFTVGDFKQAIFGFQGTNPREFETARGSFQARAAAMRAAAIEAGMPAAELPPDFLDLSVDLSFRSSPPILAAVDQVLAELGHDELGLPRPPNPHQASEAQRTGSVTLWLPFSADAESKDDDGEEGWVSDAVRRYAGRLAKQIKAWLNSPFQVECRKRALRPEDILILVRRRGALASLLVARLHAERVPVAGVDRLLLSAPLAVQDLLAAARFAVQPLDDLNLANLLVSPLFGLDQDSLYALAAHRKGPLWPHLRQSDAAPDGLLKALRSVLAMADFATPHLFFETLLSGPLDGRRKLLGRLGNEARDPIEELVSAALEFDVSGRPSLQAFLDWFARGEVEIVRDPSGPQDSVRVMTVHGSKGLQSPVVILADACADPSRLGPNARLTELELERDMPPVPVPRPRKEEMVEPLASHILHQDRLDREEHWRLLYVAMTRAEERLYLGGALGTRDRDGAPEASWHRTVESALIALGADWHDSSDWGLEMRLGAAEVSGRRLARALQPGIRLPDWASRPAAPEARPPRPLAPSAIGADDVASPPAGPEQRWAAERGRLLHTLFESLPAVATDRRREIAERWLANAGVADAEMRDGIAADACRIIDHPEFAVLFGAAALAEVPLAAVVGDGMVLAGTVDRLLVEEDRVLVADFKTGRRIPASADATPPAYLRQMAAYRSALKAIFPDRTIESVLIFTAGPTLVALPDELLDDHAPTG